MNIAIVGAGLVGRLTAINLLKNDNHNITLYDKDSKDGVTSAGFVAAGMVSPYSELENAEPIVCKMGEESAQMWPAILQTIGVHDGYENNGTIVTAHAQDLGELQRFIKIIKNKAPQSANIELLDNEQIQSLEPDLHVRTKAFFIKGEGAIDSQKFTSSSVDYFDSLPNVDFIEHTEVSKIESGKVHHDGGMSEYDWVFDTRGLGASEHFSELRGVRGELLWIEAKDIHITRPTRLMHPRYKIYIVPRSSYDEYSSNTYQKYVVGATQIESDDMSDISVRSSMELLSALYTLNPGFGEARVVRTLTHCRPAFKDNLPLIENSNKLTRINGLYRHGYLLAPSVVEQALNEGIRKRDD